MKCPDCDADAHPAWRAHWFAPVVVKQVVVHTPMPAVVHAKKRMGDRHKNDEARKAYRREWMKRKRQKEAGVSSSAGLPND